VKVRENIARHEAFFGEALHGGHQIFMRAYRNRREIASAPAD
jgi:hypothetical protein